MLYLKYNLAPMENAFLFQIVSQSEEVTNFVKDSHVFIAKNGWKIRVDQEPEIDADNKTIYLQGADYSKNLNVYTHDHILSNRMRDRVISEVHDALADLVSKVKSLKYKTYNPYRNSNEDDITGLYIVVIQ